MTVRECYEAMGADYDEVIRRLRTDERVGKFLLKVLDDPSYHLLCTSLEEKNMDEAFRAAHTLKGICQNLSLVRLYETSAVLSDYLKVNRSYDQKVESMMEAVKEEYQNTREAVSKLG